MIKSVQDEEETYLGLFLQCAEKSESWSCNVQIDYKLKAQQSIILTKTAQHLLNKEINDWGYKKFSKWKDILKHLKETGNDLKNEFITAEIYFTVDIPKNVAIIHRKLQGKHLRGLSTPSISYLLFAIRKSVFQSDFF